MLTTTVDLTKKYDYHADKFQKAYDFLSRSDLGELQPGSYPIDGDEVYANVQHYLTIPAAETAFETHDRYCDIQYMVEGEERFGYMAREALAGLALPYDAEKDVAFYQEPDESKAAYLFLRPGDLIIVPPEDAHKPRCMASGPCPVKKIVIKVRV